MLQFSKFVVAATSTDETRPTLTCVEVREYQGETVAAATDGFRLHLEIVSGVPAGIYRPIDRKACLFERYDDDDGPSFPDWGTIVPETPKKERLPVAHLFAPRLPAAKQLAREKQYVSLSAQDGGGYQYNGILPYDLVTGGWIINTLYWAEALWWMKEPSKIIPSTICMSTKCQITTQPIRLDCVQHGRTAVIMPVWTKGR